ncbi:hybrid sensor histidine kinase/response regulator [Sphaerospermopsis aphanizomenoides BCCUSP55]|uniref:hybrid sensor histidine kinase/response regulator n=1 Tax=Sphaerospermopsis aphanizomenoides TaxID=459663 RepID=UPI001906CD57|nr:hybrid sensor histidine kinase/response regulator [Sphaerospermopsis aphanizomenoides]MBK1988789.1 hybrid sensor histidine kinase/response regulator [Sphaerospermopsis aphanizomenoides BCCUSP55]
MSNYTILELLRQEVETNIAILKKCLTLLKNQQFSWSEIDQAIQATQSLWGTTTIVEMAAAANLLQLIKDCLISVQKQNISLGVEEIDILLHASDLLLSMSKAAAGNFDSWMTDHAWDWNTTEKIIVNLINREKVLGDSVEEKKQGVSNKNKNPSSLEVPQISSDGNSVMDLFRLEAQEQVSILNNGLLSIENQPKSASDLEALMRAAHSIKGAARIVGLDGVVELAHVMEDCFVAAQKQTMTLTSEDVDVLLEGVDLLQNISQLNDVELIGWVEKHQFDFQKICDHVAAILQPGDRNQKAKIDIDVRIIDQPPIPSSQSLVPSPQSLIPNFPFSSTNRRVENIAKNHDRVVRLSADNLNRIMDLAGESLIEANWLQPFADSMMSLKSRMVDISRNLEQLQESLDQNLYEQEGKEYLTQVRQQKQECLDYIGDRLDELELYVRRTASLSNRLYREVINSQMRPFEDGLQGFPRMIRDLARNLNKRVKLEIVGKSTPVDRDILTKLEAPLTHILRNAVDHGIELPEERIASGKSPEGTIRLEAVHRGGMLVITISDDGKGINREQLRQQLINQNLVTADMADHFSDAELIEFLFLPGFSTAQQLTEISGRGVGLDIAKSMAQEVGGIVRANSQPGKGTSFHFQLPLTLSVVRTLLVEISEKPYAIPLARIDQIINLERSEIYDVENRQYFTLNNQNIGLIAAHQVLELPPAKQQTATVSIVIVSDQNSSYGLVVDRFLGEKSLVVRPLDPRLGKVPDISATAVLGDGSPILIIDISDLMRSMDTILKGGNLSKLMMQAELENVHQRRKILVVDDSITVREMERKLLENRGYQVDVAVNGVEGWNAVRTKEYDLVISDIDMPRMNGIELVKQIKANPRLNSLPVIIISYRDREEDRIQGLEVGADYYLTKSSFHDDTLINAVIDLIGQ